MARFRPHPEIARELGTLHRLPILAEILLRVTHVVALWAHRAGTRRALAEMEAWQLRDIGLTEAAALREARKPFWRA